MSDSDSGGVMTHTIYLDILFCVNFIIDYMILVSVKKYLSLEARLRRLLLGAAAGGLSSFVILLPPLPSGLSIIISLASACFVVGAAFAPADRKTFFKASAAFFLVSFGFCGIMMALFTIFTPESVVIRNSSVYIEIPPVMLVIATLFCYVILRVIMRITGSGKPKETECSVRVRYSGHEIAFKGRLDTGNMLKEPFSGMPVIVSKRSAFACIDENEMKGSMRVVPFSSVGGEGLLYAFRPEEIMVISGGVKHRVSAFVALCDDERIVGGEDAVIPFELIA